MSLVLEADDVVFRRPPFRFLLSWLHGTDLFIRMKKFWEAAAMQVQGNAEMQVQGNEHNYVGYDLCMKLKLLKLEVEAYNMSKYKKW